METQPPAPPGANSPPQPLMVAQVLWGAFLASQGLFTAVLFIAVQPQASSPGEAIAILRFYPVLISALPFVFKDRLENLGLEYLVLCVLRFALFESIGIVGLVIGFLGGAYPWIYMIWAASLIFFFRPNADEMRKIEANNAARKSGGNPMVK